MAIDNGNGFTLGDNTVRLGDVVGVNGVVSPNTYWVDVNQQPLGGPLPASSGFTFPTDAPPGCEFHEILEVEMDAEGDLVGTCDFCDQKVIVDAGILGGLAAKVLARLADVLAEKDVDLARVALGELGPEVREARKVMEKIDRMMSMLERSAKVS